ncbi:unnamed protein product [Macrosiphum euphorbiae]|uniref:Secreted protein n=1 Tax=Macrosiphum euphorbiae TaxID=13131 RepID=A0AAV0VT93_9HEMI|nr:unnamed protein product [Macrosiphum euphorbiae]
MKRVGRIAAAATSGLPAAAGASRRSLVFRSGLSGTHVGQFHSFFHSPFLIFVVDGIAHNHVANRPSTVDYHLSLRHRPYLLSVDVSYVTSVSRMRTTGNWTL